jgi:hypothetical protein
MPVLFCCFLAGGYQREAQADPLFNFIITLSRITG